MPTQTVCLSLSHRTSPIEVRERLTCSLAHFRHASPEPAAWQLVKEAVLLATCNRWEFYACLDDGVADARGFILDLVGQPHGFGRNELAGHSYFYAGAAAHCHLLRVACGLDSQVLGEAQILGQANDAYQRSLAQKFAGSALAALFEAGISAGKRARSETPINCHPSNISSVAVALAQDLAGDLRQRRLAVIGMGEMGRLALKALRARDVRDIVVVNRTYERAAAVAEGVEYKGMGLCAWRWDELDQAVVWADVLFVATTAHEFLLTAAQLRELAPARGDRPLVIVDMAVPRNVDPDVATAGPLPGVSLVDIDDLQSGLDEGWAARQAAIPQVEAIIAEELAALDARLLELAIRPLIADLRQRVEDIRAQEMARTLKFLGDVDPETLRHLQHFSLSLVNKLLHQPMLRLRHQARQNEAESYATALRHLFALDEDASA